MARLDVVVLRADLATARRRGRAAGSRLSPVLVDVVPSVADVAVSSGRRRRRRPCRRRIGRGRRSSSSSPHAAKAIVASDRDGRGDGTGAEGATHGAHPTRPRRVRHRREQSPDHGRRGLTSSAMQGLMQDVPLSITHPVRAGGAELRAQGRRHGDGRRARARDVRRLGRAHPAPRRRARRARHRGRRPRRRRSPGTRPATSSCTSPPRAPGACCTRSTSGSSPSS